MKKGICSIFLLFAMFFSVSGAVFSDIMDSKLQQTAQMLDSFGIMQGTGNGKFSPSSTLTRSQFCKLVVTARKCEGVSGYANYTIFPDVKRGTWYAQYVNAAVRHPDFRTQPIIKGFTDGTFGPDKPVSYGEACTMLLRMLGYTENDVGAFWPSDYIAFAGTLGITDGVSNNGAYASLSRADAANMIFNSLTARTKSGETLLNNFSAGLVSDCLILEIGPTSTLLSNEALLLEGGYANIRRFTGISAAEIGNLSGTAILNAQGNAIIGFLPEMTVTKRTFVIQSATQSEITTSGKTVNFSALPIHVRGEDRLRTYAQIWTDLMAGQTITIYYDSSNSAFLMQI